jgi:nucleoid DNA-binding protein
MARLNELVDDVALVSDTPKTRTKAVLAALPPFIIDALIRDKEFRIPGMGIFYISAIRPRKIHKFNGEIVMTGETNTIRFKPVAAMKQLLNPPPEQPKSSRRRSL